MHDLEITCIPDEDNKCKEAIIYCAACGQKYKVSQLTLTRKTSEAVRKDRTVVTKEVSQLEVSDMEII